MKTLTVKSFLDGSYRIEGDDVTLLQKKTLDDIQPGDDVVLVKETPSGLEITPFVETCHITSFEERRLISVSRSDEFFTFEFEGKVTAHVEDYSLDDVELPVWVRKVE